MVIRSFNGVEARKQFDTLYDEDINYLEIHKTPGGIAVDVVVQNDIGDDWELIIELTHTDLLVIKEMIKKGLI